MHRSYSLISTLCTHSPPPTNQPDATQDTIISYILTQRRLPQGWGNLSYIVKHWFFWGVRRALGSPGSPGTPFVDQPSPELKEISLPLPLRAGIAGLCHFPCLVASSLDFVICVEVSWRPARRKSKPEIRAKWPISLPAFPSFCLASAWLVTIIFRQEALLPPRRPGYLRWD